MPTSPTRSPAVPPLASSWVGIVFVVVILTRLPFHFNGYGADGDAWRVAAVAERLWTTGEYLPSRLPGYPLHEIVSAPFVGLGGAPLSNAATLVAALLMLAVWARIADREGKHKKLLLLGLAFAPMVWQHSAETIDYVWSLLFLVLSLDAALRSKGLPAGVWLGIAAGFRPSNAILVAPIFLILLLHSPTKRDAMKFLATAAGTVFVVFLPVIAKFGFSGWIEATRVQMQDVLHPGFVERLAGFGYRSVYSIGPLAVILVLFLAVRHRRGIVAHVRSSDPLMIASLTTFVVMGIQFFWLPFDRAYLMPVLPLLLLLVDRYSSRWSFTLFTAAFLLHGLVNLDISNHDPGKPGFGPHVHYGMVIEEYQNREKLIESRARIPAGAPPGPAYIMTGLNFSFWFQNIHVEVESTEHWDWFTDPVSHKRGERTVRFVPYLRREEVERVKAQGYEVYCLADLSAWIERAAGFRMEELGVKVISI